MFCPDLDCFYPREIYRLLASLLLNRGVCGPLGYLNLVHLLGLRKFMKVLKAKTDLRVQSLESVISVLVLAYVVFPHHLSGWLNLPSPASVRSSLVFSLSVLSLPTGSTSGLSPRGGRHPLRPQGGGEGIRVRGSRGGSYHIVQAASHKAVLPLGWAPGSCLASFILSSSHKTTLGPGRVGKARASSRY